MSASPPSRRAALALLAGAAAAPSRLAAETAGPRFRPRRGVSAWPWFSLTREHPAPRTDYAWPPFQEGRPVPSAGDLRELSAIGFDFVRIPVDPGPFAAFVGESRRELVRQVLAAVDAALAAGLGAIVDLHPNEATHHWTTRFFATDPDGRARYRDLIEALAEPLGRRDPARVALEPMNEPPQACGAAEWAELQATMTAHARSAAPGLTLVLTGACGGMVPGLEGLTPLPDANTLYSFHLYEPYLFSHQGAVWMTGEPIYRYLNGVPWPGDPRGKAATRAASLGRLAADPALRRHERDAIAAEIDRVLDQYFAARPGKAFLEGYLDRVRAWAESHRVPPGRILLGEFGALRSGGRYVAGAEPDRLRYLADLRKGAEARGFGWAYWNLFDGFGIYTDEAARTLDRPLLVALGFDAVMR